jgi:hypothetical protein
LPTTPACLGSYCAPNFKPAEYIKTAFPLPTTSGAMEHGPLPAVPCERKGPDHDPIHTTPRAE